MKYLLDFRDNENVEEKKSRIFEKSHLDIENGKVVGMSRQ